jgi:AcrR family transcriptional regulator
MNRKQGKKSPGLRTPRRPGPSGNPDIRDSILDFAEFLFATRGFNATSVREIAERVEVTPAMVHYYFGSKQRLLQSVMERALEPMAQVVAEIEKQGEASLGELTRRLFEMASEHPYLPQLITREVFLPGGQVQEHFLKHFAPRLGGRLPAILRNEQRQGRVDAGLDPQIAALLMLSLCMFPFVARPAAETVLGVAYDEAGLRRLLQHVTALLERGLRT